jgi:catechol 2,3-dioxygenase-like lactoylglutathione lyase family enzyme
MLLSGVNHMALLTHDTDRLVAFYREVFDAEIGAHLEEFDGAIQLTFIRIGPTAELNVFQIEGNTEADRQAPMFGRGASTTSGCKPPRSTRSTRSGTG